MKEVCGRLMSEPPTLTVYHVFPRKKEVKGNKKSVKNTVRKEFKLLTYQPLPFYKSRPFNVFRTFGLNNLSNKILLRCLASLISLSYEITSIYAFLEAL